MTYPKSARAKSNPNDAQSNRICDHDDTNNGIYGGKVDSKKKQLDN